MEKEKKVVKLDQPYYAQAIKRDNLDLPNHLAQKLRWYHHPIEALHRLSANLKKCCYWLLNALIVLLLTGGLALGWFSWQAYNGRPTFFSTIELIGLENDQQEIAKTLAHVQDVLSNTKMELSDLKKVVAKNNKK